MGKALPNAFGHFNLVDFEDATLTLSGWMLMPDVPMDSLKVIVDNEVVQTGPLIESKDVFEAFPFIPYAIRSMFHVYLPKEKKYQSKYITVVGLDGDKEVAKLETFFSEDLRPKLDFPDTLKMRVANNSSKSFFAASSFTSFRNFYDQVQRHADPSALENMLDWGYESSPIW